MKNNDLLGFMGIQDNQIEKAKTTVKKEVTKLTKPKTSVNPVKSELTKEFVVSLNKEHVPKTKPTSLRMHPYTKELIHSLAKQTKRSESFIINELLKKALKIK